MPKCEFTVSWSAREALVQQDNVRVQEVVKVVIVSTQVQVGISKFSKEVSISSLVLLDEMKTVNQK